MFRFHKGSIEGTISVVVRQIGHGRIHLVVKDLTFVDRYESNPEKWLSNKTGLFHLHNTQYSFTLEGGFRYFQLRKTATEETGMIESKAV